MPFWSETTIEPELPLEARAGDTFARVFDFEADLEVYDSFELTLRKTWATSSTVDNSDAVLALSSEGDEPEIELVVPEDEEETPTQLTVTVDASRMHLQPRLYVYDLQGILGDERKTLARGTFLLFPQASVG